MSESIEFVDLDVSPEGRERYEKLWASKTRQEVLDYCSVKMMPVKSQLAYLERCKAKWTGEPDG